MWLFAVLVVLAMGGVALVASGRTGALPEEYDDRPDVRVPVGRLHGSDLRRVRFSLAVRGYRMSEVDTLLARLADQLDTPTDQTPAETAHETSHGGPPPL
ncbi:DivIVA domain-containing protein [Nocardioides sp.]|uniref:DivIVA domain-containing protein n=1 Tax=Nocardioides sp. TaxID=35761 RepID=UPI00286E4943|nr:DivIVA domain-containing protein [Nocardioides sp.]